MHTIKLLIVFCSFCALFFSCGSLPSDTQQNHAGTLDVRIWISKPAVAVQTPKTRETTWNRLIIAVSASDMDTIQDTFALDMQKSFYSFSIENVAAGPNRTIRAWTIDAGGDTIHGAVTDMIDIEPAQTLPVVLELYPIRGSLYVVLTGFPASVDSVLFSFQTINTLWKTVEAKTSKLTLTLDKIPFGSSGTLSIIGYSASGDTVASWTKTGFTFSNANTTIEASFVSVGALSIEASITTPGVALIVGTMDGTGSLEDETGGLIISEIMYAANDSEYIEIYNPQTDTFHDTIIVQKDNGTFRYYKVRIPPNGFFVIGRINLSELFGLDSNYTSDTYNFTYHPTNTALDLSSTTGNWLSLRSHADSSLMDMVVFLTGTNTQGWPGISGKKSIVLDSLPDDPEYNNYGRNWVPATSSIDISKTQQLGTPGNPGE